MTNVRSGSKGLRARLFLAAIAMDAAALVSAYVFAVWLRAGSHLFGRISAPATPLHWSLVVFAITVYAGAYSNGLYELEVFVSRPLHVWRLVRVAFGGLLASAVALYLLRLDSLAQSRFILLATFPLFLLLAGTLRLGLLDRLFIRSTGNPVTVLLGSSSEARVLEERLCGLRSFSRLEVLAPSEIRSDSTSSLSHSLEEQLFGGDSVGAVFIDALSFNPREVLEITRTTMRHGIDVYIRSSLLGSLDGNGLLSSLFQAPAIRVRRNLDSASPHLFKRLFDVVGSAALLILAFPLVAVVAVLIKATSPGPVFYTQTRVGKLCMPFRLLKFRSMVVNEDATQHAQYVKAFIAGEAEAVDTPEGAVFKCIDDPRITPVGRFIRKYSIDEIPQFWNVLKGDMSLVGPRPPLSYEVEYYDEWARARLTAPPGVTGVWQVAGRSRVSFDEMVLQDIMYAKNMSLAVDVDLCLRTVPAVLLGFGGG